MSADKLAEELRNASETYYNTGETVMADAEFDAKKKQLEELDPNHPFLTEVGAPTSGHLQKVKHNMPMGSLNNANNEEEFTAWLGKVPEDTGLVVMHKLDGSSIEIIYKDGKLVQAITRGDGFEGEDITQNVRKFKNVPTTLDENWNGSVRGEAMLLKADFEEHFSGSANPRNAANGTCRRSDGTGSEHIIFKAFDAEGDDVEENPHKDDMHSSKLFGLGLLGFEAVDYDILSPGEVLVERVMSMRESTIDGREDLPYEIDGLVIRVNDNDVFEDMDIRNNRPKAAVAFKLNAVEAVTTLEHVELSLGHTGAIIPTAKLKPVHLMGVTITSALLNNFEEIERLGVAIGDEVKVIRAGDVIPKIIGVAQHGKNRQPIETPTVCIVCNSLLVKDGAHLFCRNDSCEGKEEMQLKNWIKKRDIKYIGDSLRETLFNTNVVRSPHELYSLTEEGLSGTPIGNGVVGGNAKRIMAEIEKSKTASLSEFMGSLGVKFLGRRQAVHMIEGGVDTLEKFTELTIEGAEALDGFSISKATQIVTGIQACLGEIHALQEAGVTVIDPDQEQEVEAPSGDGVLSGKSFVFTGKVERVGEDGKRFTRSKLQGLVAQNGGDAWDKVGGGLTYLVQADPTSQSSKTKKAQKQGTEILSEAAFFELIGM